MPIVLQFVTSSPWGWFQNRDWLPKKAIVFSEFCNSKGACPGFATPLLKDLEMDRRL